MLSPVKKIRELCAEYEMIPPNSRVYAAVSGGKDSMCLLTALMELEKELGFHLSVCHFNHRLRGEESDGDAAFVRAYCRDRNIPYVEGSGDVAGESARRGIGLEEAARNLRYAFFEGLEDGALVATAHTADDNAETLLMHLLRGTGPQGMGGIPPVRGRYLRPMLRVTRQEVEAYLEEKRIPRREDSSNALDDALRNRIRHRVIPLLEEMNPRFSENASFAAGLLYEDNRLLEEQAAVFLEKHRRGNRLPVSALRGLDAPLRERALRLMCGPSLEREHVAMLESLLVSESPSSAADLPGLRVRREYGDLVFGGQWRAGESFLPVALTPGGAAEIPRLGLRFRLTELTAGSVVYNSLTDFLFKKSEVYGIVTVRPRAAGDVIKLPGRGTRTLKKLFIDRKIPLTRRPLLPVIADDRGVLAVVGIGADERAKPDPGEPVYHLQVEETGNEPSGY